MSCGKDHHTGSCVCDILKEIAGVQDDIANDCCDTGCEQSINDLLGTNEGGPGLDTVPLLLYCSSTCEPFKGYGAYPRDISKKVSSFYFRVKKVSDDCCAVIELLVDRSELGQSKNQTCPYTQKTDHLRATGICITVDLKCFCHVTCLPAINAM